MTIDPLVPDGAEFLGQQSFQLSVAPIRRALLVRDQDAAQLRSALRAAMAMWGGARYPILPLRDSGDVDPGWVELADLLGVEEVLDYTGQKPDGSVERSEGDAGSAWTGAERTRFPVRLPRPLDDAEFWNPHPVLLDPSLTPVQEMMVAGDSRLVSLAGAGGYGLPEEVATFRAHGWNILEDAPESVLARGQLAQRTPAGATLVGDVDTNIEGPLLVSAGLVWVCSGNDDQDFNDAVWFWNNRAARPRYLNPPPVEVLTTEETATDASFIPELVGAIAATSGSTPSFIIASHTVPADTLREIAAALGAQEHKEKKVSERIFGRPNGAGAPLTFSVNRDPMSFWMCPRRSGRVTNETVHLRRPDTSMTFVSPVAWTRQHLRGGRVRVELSSPTLEAPQVPGVAQLFNRNASWSGPGRLRMRMLNELQYNLALGLPTPEQVLDRVVSTQGATIRRSDKAQQLDGLLARGLGASPSDLAVYRDPATCFVLDSLTAKAGRDLAREIRAMRESDSVSDEALERLLAASLVGDRPARPVSDLRSLPAPEDVKRASVVTVLDELTARGLVEMGLVVECPLCSLREFQPLHEIREGARCRGCGSRAAFKSGVDGSPEVSYRLTTLLHTISLNGGLAPLTAHAVLVGERSHVVPGANLFREDELVGEVDLVGWKVTTVFAGEAKKSAVGFENADADAELDKAVMCGANAFLLVCLETLGEDVVGRFQSAADARSLRLRVMDRGHLLTNG